jgi:hypothetical protein
MGRRLALLIATYEYQDAGLRRLTAPAHDAQALAAVLEDPRIAGFEVTVLLNEPHYRVGEVVGEFYRNRRRDDLTLLYFSGHGLKDDDGRLYLAMANTRRDSLLFTGLSAEAVDQAMEGCLSRQKLLILDCCYSGAYPAGRLAKADMAVHTLERFQGRGRTVLTASDSTQYAFEGDQPHGQAAQSVFTRYLVEGLRDGGADLDGDGDITVDELYAYVHDRVVAQTLHQRPKKQDNVQGRTVVATNVNWTLPLYLRHAVRSPLTADRLAALDGLDHLHRIGNNLVRGKVHEELARLAADDSKTVSAAAAARLRSLTPDTGAGSAATPAPPSPSVRPAGPPGPAAEGSPSTMPPDQLVHADQREAPEGETQAALPAQEPPTTPSHLKRAPSPTAIVDPPRDPPPSPAPQHVAPPPRPAAPAYPAVTARPSARRPPAPASGTVADAFRDVSSDVANGARQVAARATSALGHTRPVRSWTRPNSGLPSTRALMLGWVLVLIPPFGLFVACSAIVKSRKVGMPPRPSTWALLIVGLGYAIFLVLEAAL